MRNDKFIQLLNKWGKTNYKILIKLKIEIFYETFRELLLNYYVNQTFCTEVYYKCKQNTYWLSKSVFVVFNICI